MKKIPALFLALALCLGLAVPALAADAAAPSEPRVYPVTPENSGIIVPETEKLEGMIWTDFVRSGSDDSHISYWQEELMEVTGYVGSAPKGVNVVVTGVSSADEVRLKAISTATLNVADGSTKEGLFPRLFTWEDGDVVIDSERLYALLGECDLFEVVIGDSFWMYWLSGEPKLISSVFTDVEAGKWFADPVTWAWSNGIAAGKSETSFAPGDDCTQAQILTFLYRAQREEQAKPSAEDMDNAVSWAKEKGMIDDSFDGSVPCTRATAVSYIWQAFDKPAAAASSFTDVDADADYAKAVDWANEKKITVGADGKFDPNGICNRAYIATFLYRAYNH